MRKFIVSSLVVLLAFSGIKLEAQDAPINTDNVFVLPIRRVKAGQDIEDFKAKREAYVAWLEASDGTLTDREFQPFFEFTNSGLPVDSVFVGLTSFADFQTFGQIGSSIDTSVANAFFSTFDFISFQVLQPLDQEETVDLADFANLGTSQVWEVAVRDISQYENFDEVDYEEKRDAYLAVLAAQSNFVREVQWRSLSDTNVVVGMTVYKDAQSYAAVNADTSFINAYLATGFLQSYPINVYGAIHNVLKGSLDSSCIDIGQGAFPEDVTAFEENIFTSNYFNGAITRTNVSTGEREEFVPAASDEFSSAWGLRIDSANQQLLSIANQFYDFNPANAKAGKVNAYNLTDGSLAGSWALPAQAVGNSIDIDSEGNIYVGDIGPDTRILKINPQTDEVSAWADDSQWTDGGFGTGGMVYDQKGGFYVAHAGFLWYVAINEDGSAASAKKVSLTGTVALDGSETVNADGMTWAGENSIFYAENDVFTPGHNGIVHRITLTDDTTGQSTVFESGFDDCSGLFLNSFEGKNTLYVNESQFGVNFGVNFVPTSNPFCVRAFEITDLGTPTSVEDQLDDGVGQLFNLYPNPSSQKITVELLTGEKVETFEIMNLQGQRVETLSINDLRKKSFTLSLNNLESGIYMARLRDSSGKSLSQKFVIK